MILGIIIGVAVTLVVQALLRKRRTTDEWIQYAFRKKN